MSVAWGSKLLAAVALLGGMALAQRPQPFLAGGVSAFDVVGGATVGGVFYDSAHFTSVDEGGYETGGKSNDNDNTSSSGHTRYLRGEAEVKFKGWGFGPGIDWSKTYTPDYSKSHVHPRAYVVFPRTEYWSRLTVAYVHPGTDWQNGVQGFQAQVWLGSGHLFGRITAGGYWAHTTVTEPTNAVLTAEQKSQHTATSDLQGLIGWRF